MVKCFLPFVRPHITLRPKIGLNLDTLNIILNAFAGATAFAAAFALRFTRHQNRLANQFLAGALACIGCVLIESAIFYNNDLLYLARWDVFLDWLMPAISPFVWLYVRAMTEPGYRFSATDSLHFIPAAAIELWSISQFNEIPTTTTALLTWFNPARQLQGLVLQYSIMGLLFFYLYLSWSRLLRHQRAMHQLTADAETRDLLWLRRCLLSMSGMWLIWVFDSHNVDTPAFLPIAILLYIICLYYIGYHALKQNYAFQNLQTVDLPLLEKLAALPLPRLLDPKLEPLKKQLTELLEQENLWRDNELTLPKLAARLNASPNAVSEVLNKGFGVNFFQFINGYRVEEAKRMLVDPKMAQITLESVGYEAGFNSKTTFNTTFKKTTGKSPSEWRWEGKSI